MSSIKSINYLGNYCWTLIKRFAKSYRNLNFDKFRFEKQIQ